MPHNILEQSIQKQMLDWRCSKPKRQKHNNSESCDARWNRKTSGTVTVVFDKLAGKPTLYIIDDCSATKELTKKKDMLSELAFSGRHANQSVWVISRRYISVLKDLREQTKWVCMFYIKNGSTYKLLVGRLSNADSNANSKNSNADSNAYS